MESTLATLQEMSREINAHVKILREIQLDGEPVHLTASSKKAADEDSHPPPSRSSRVNSSLVLDLSTASQIDATNSEVTSQAPELSADAPCSATATQSRPISIAPIKQEVPDMSNSADKTPATSGSFTISSVTRRDLRSPSGDSSRASTPLRVLPAGKRYCLGEIVHLQVVPLTETDQTGTQRCASRSTQSQRKVRTRMRSLDS